MAKFASPPPSSKPAPEGNYFTGGLMVVGPMTTTGLIIFDLRSLNLPVADGRAIEGVVREALFKELDRLGLSQNRGAVDLGSAVHGIAID